MITREITAKSILSASKIYRYVVNPYIGCRFGCLYCYARYMKRFTGHSERWGEFVDIKTNAPELLHREITRKKRDRVWISGVCDPYQPLEKTYGITASCLEILVQNDWPLVIQTKSPLVLRDTGILQKASDCEVGFSIGTAEDDIRRIFEPGTPPVRERLEALKVLHDSGIRTYVMIAPILPGAEGLVGLLDGLADYVYVDRMNYSHAADVYKKHDLQRYHTDGYFHEVGRAMNNYCDSLGIPCSVFF